MKLSYGITVCNEHVEIQRLITFLLENKREQDEIVILFDKKNGTEAVEDYLRSHSVNGEFIWYGENFENHFADWKNKLTSLCSGDFIFQIDADEIPNKTLLDNIIAVIESNDENEVYWVPRINTVEGLTQEDINQWGWNVNEKGWVNFPDPQMRIYRNREGIVWQNKVHERLDGFRSYAMLPTKEEWCLYHPKDIERQRKQNAYYDTL